MKKILTIIAAFAAANLYAADGRANDGLHANGSIRHLGEAYRGEEYYESHEDNPGKELEFAIKLASEHNEWYVLKNLSLKSEAAKAALEKLLAGVKARAESKDAEAEYALSQYFFNMEDYEAGEKYLRLAAEHGQRNAVISVGYRESRGEQYPRAAFELGDPGPLLQHLYENDKGENAADVIGEFKKRFPEKKEETLDAYLSAFHFFNGALAQDAVEYCRMMLRENPADLRPAAIMYAVSKSEADKSEAEKYLNAAPSEMKKLEFLDFAYNALLLAEPRIPVMRRMAELGTSNPEIYFDLGLLVAIGRTDFFLLDNIMAGNYKGDLPEAAKMFEKAYEAAAADDNFMKFRAAFSAHVAYEMLKDYGASKKWLLLCEKHSENASSHMFYVDAITNYLLGRYGFERNPEEAQRLMKKLEGNEDEFDILMWVISNIENNYANTSYGGLSMEERLEIVRGIGEKMVDDLDRHPEWINKEGWTNLLDSAALSDEYIAKLYGKLPRNSENAFYYAMRLCSKKKDFSAAIEPLKNAAELGGPDAMLILYACYYSGRGVEKNTEIANAWLKKALDTYEGYEWRHDKPGLGLGINRIEVSLNFNNDVVSGIYNAAVEYPKFDTPHFNREYLLNLLNSSKPDEAKLAKALSKVNASKRISKDINPINFYNLYSGEYGENFADKAKAVAAAKEMYDNPQWFEHSPENRLVYPLMLFYGKDVPEDKAEAVELISAVKNENGEIVPEAAALLGYFYANGIGVGKDEAKADSFRNIGKKSAYGLAGYFGGVYDLYGLFPHDDAEAQYYFDEYARQSEAKKSK